MEAYAKEQTARLIDKFGEALDVTSQKADAGAIHDVRVAIRRLKRALRVFAPFYPNSDWKKIRERLSELMTMAGAVRDCDIAVELLGQAGTSSRAAIVTKLLTRRQKAGEEFLLEIRRWEKRRYLDKWRGRLGL